MDMDKKNMLERVVKAARKAYMKGFAAGSGGNVSIRIQGQVYISPSGICLGDLTQEDMIMLEADGVAPPADMSDPGRRRPSKEAGMHLACYRSRPDIQCLFHLHSPYSIAAACRRQGNGSRAMGMPAYTPGYAMRVGRIPVVPYYRPGSRELAEAVSDVICSRDSLLLANHGMVAAGKSPEAVLAAARAFLEDLGGDDENAHLTILLGDRGIPLDEEQTEALFRAGGTV